MPHSLRVKAEGNMKLLTIAAALLAAGLTGTSATAQDLWRGVQVGMSPEQVQDLLPEAKFASGEDIQGEALRLRAGGFELANVAFEANFYFAGESLQSVILRPEAEQSATIVMSLAEDIIPQLGLKYGPPYDCEINRHSISGITGTHCNWLSGGAQIGLSASHMSYSLPHFSLVYQRAKLDTDNL